MDDNNNITINDVAKAAGVSKGTVDRVLHDRGEVSAKSKEKILKVIRELGYKPNVYASLLASRKVRKIVCLVPEHEHGEFWELTEKGIETGSMEAAKYGVSVVTIRYDQYDLDSYQRACTLVLEEKPLGVVLAPMFRSYTLSFVRELSERGICYVYIDSKLEDDGYLAYFGMPMYQSGYLCADILTSGTVPESINMIRIERDKKGLSDPTVTRRTGFCDYINERFPECVLNNVFIDPKDRNMICSTLDNMFETTPSSHIVMFNSRIHLVTDYLRDRGIHDCRVVGFDVLEKNLAAVRDGYVQMLIAQHTDQQASAAINSIIESAVLHRPLAKRDNFTQMDILNRYNCDYYL
ncbi:MAG: LacI family transcriptional regulator [Clostridium sp.]|nr:LacI family transcriptional regulator [Bacteroides sp.]MCM1198869.1 LacI family transcriptional regulator [Clostridium sp.]